MAFAGLALGILALVSAWFPFMDIIAWLLALCGIAFSVAGIGRSFDHGKISHAIVGASLSMLAMFSKIAIYTYLFKNMDGEIMKAMAPILKMISDFIS